MTEYDALIVGAGVLGLSAAYHIARMRPNDKILVVEQMSSSDQGNTAKSAAMFRTFLSTVQRKETFPYLGGGMCLHT